MPSGEAAAVADELTSADEALRYISHMAGRVWLCYISPNKYAALMVGAGIIHPTVMDRRCAVVMYYCGRLAYYDLQQCVYMQVVLIEPCNSVDRNMNARDIGASDALDASITGAGSASAGATASIGASDVVTADAPTTADGISGSSGGSSSGSGSNLCSSGEAGIGDTCDIRVSTAGFSRSWRARLAEAMTDCCPRCRRAFIFRSNHECFAVTCVCGCNFCAWCLEDCGRDAHSHVVSCPLNLQPDRSVFSSTPLLERCRLRRQRSVLTAMLTLLDRDEAAAVVRTTCDMLLDRGLADVVERFSGSGPTATPRAPDPAAYYDAKCVICQDECSDGYEPHPGCTGSNSRAHPDCFARFLVNLNYRKFS
jgi:hypothetical protein